MIGKQHNLIATEEVNQYRGIYTLSSKQITYHVRSTLKTKPLFQSKGQLSKSANALCSDVSDPNQRHDQQYPPFVSFFEWPQNRTGESLNQNALILSNSRVSPLNNTERLLRTVTLDGSTQTT